MIFCKMIMLFRSIEINSFDFDCLWFKLELIKHSRILNEAFSFFTINLYKNMYGKFQCAVGDKPIQKKYASKSLVCQQNIINVSCTWDLSHNKQQKFWEICITSCKYKDPSKISFHDLIAKSSSVGFTFCCQQ